MVGDFILECYKFQKDLASVYMDLCFSIHFRNFVVHHSDLLSNMVHFRSMRIRVVISDLSDFKRSRRDLQEFDILENKNRKIGPDKK